ncbi:MAG: hypothetical protein GY861_29190 [bacterium]|nr:hypothetical protein [bacterium]
MMNKTIKWIFVFFLLLVPLAYGADFLPIGYWGLVFIDGANATLGTVVDGYVGGTLTTTTTTPTIGGIPDNGYKLNVAATDGQTVLFKVYGIDALTTTWNVAQSGSTINVNLSVNRTLDGGPCPDTYTGIPSTVTAADGHNYVQHLGCLGGVCVNPGAVGVCSSNNWYCDGDGNCEPAYGENYQRCPNDNCPITSSSSSGGGTSTGCNREKIYSDWSDCINGVMTREIVEQLVNCTKVETIEEKACGEEDSEEEEEEETTGTGGNVLDDSSKAGVNDTSDSGEAKALAGFAFANLGQPKYIIGIGILLLMVIVGVGVYFFYGKKKTYL